MPRTDFIASFEQRYSSDKGSEDVLHHDRHWQRSYPNQISGPCYTYNPLYKSDPGLRYGTYIVMKDKSWDPSIEIFLHDENSLYYSRNLHGEFYLKGTKLDKLGINPAFLEGKYFTSKCSLM